MVAKCLVPCRKCTKNKPHVRCSAGFDDCLATLHTNPPQLPFPKSILCLFLFLFPPFYSPKPNLTLFFRLSHRSLDSSSSRRAKNAVREKTKGSSPPPPLPLPLSVSVGAIIPFPSAAFGGRRGREGENGWSIIVIGIGGKDPKWKRRTGEGGGGSA